MDCEPDRDRQEGAPPTSNTSLNPSSSAPYRKSEDWQRLRRLIRHPAPVEIDAADSFVDCHDEGGDADDRERRHEP